MHTRTRTIPACTNIDSSLVFTVTWRSHREHVPARRPGPHLAVGQVADDGQGRPDRHRGFILSLHRLTSFPVRSPRPSSMPSVPATRVASPAAATLQGLREPGCATLARRPPANAETGQAQGEGRSLEEPAARVAGRCSPGDRANRDYSRCGGPSPIASWSRSFLLHQLSGNIAPAFPDRLSFCRGQRIPPGFPLDEVFPSFLAGMLGDLQPLRIESKPDPARVLVLGATGFLVAPDRGVNRQVPNATDRSACAGHTPPRHADREQRPAGPVVPGESERSQSHRGGRRNVCLQQGGNRQLPDRTRAGPASRGEPHEWGRGAVVRVRVWRPPVSAGAVEPRGVAGSDSAHGLEQGTTDGEGGLAAGPGS